jgi:uncharacterized membrane protein
MSGMLFCLSGLVGVGWVAADSAVCVSRFHAWQSSLLFTALFVLHLVFSWSKFLSWVFFLGDLVLIAWLVLNAYRDADTLDRLVPFGGLAVYGEHADAVQVRSAHCRAHSEQDSGRRVMHGLRRGFCLPGLAYRGGIVWLWRCSYSLYYNVYISCGGWHQGVYWDGSMSFCGLGRHSLCR